MKLNLNFLKRTPKPSMTMGGVKSFTKSAQNRLAGGMTSAAKMPTTTYKTIGEARKAYKGTQALKNMGIGASAKAVKPMAQGAKLGNNVRKKVLGLFNSITNLSNF